MTDAKRKSDPLPHSYRKGTRPGPKKKRKSSKGVSKPRLTDEQVTKLRHAAAAGSSDSELAEHFGISPVTVGNIRRGTTRPNVAGPITIRKRGFEK